MDGRLWLRKTPGAMGCGPPDFTVPVLNSWSVRLPSWESRLCSGELLSWDLGSSITIAFFLVLFFFFLVFCCSSFWNKFLSRWDNTNRNRIYTHGTFPLHTWCESFAAAAASPVSMEATRAPSLAGRSCRGTDGPTRAVTTSMQGVTACYSNQTSNINVALSLILQFSITCRTVRSVITAFPLFWSGFEDGIIFFGFQRRVN